MIGSVIKKYLNFRGFAIIYRLGVSNIHCGVGGVSRTDFERILIFRKGKILSNVSRRFVCSLFCGRFILFIRNKLIIFMIFLSKGEFASLFFPPTCFLKMFVLNVLFIRDA